MRVAILGNGFIGWGGGIDFLINYIYALKSQPDIQIILFLPVDGYLGKVKHFLRPMKRCLASLARHGKLDFSNIPLRTEQSLQTVVENFQSQFQTLQIAYYVQEGDGLLKALRQQNIDIAFPALQSLPARYPIPWVGYIPDFQHRYMPQFFTQKECVGRDRDFGQMLSVCQALVVNAKAVKEDVYRFYPQTQANVYAMPFSPIPRNQWLSDGDVDVVGKYNLPKRYFLISNQFWIHKDHKTAFRALALLHHKQIGQDVDIVCTGKMADYRFPHYIEELQELLVDLHEQDNVHFLGYIPKRDQIEILKKSVAVVQPTLFEGGPGGGAAYDSISLGKRIILSDIPVNMDVQGNLATYFAHGNAESLAEKMADVLEQPALQPSYPALREQGKCMQENLGRALAEMLKATIADWKA